MIRGNVAVVRHGATAPSTQSGARSLGALPVPNAGQWLGSTPAGCEVCRGSPAENESPTLDRDLLNQPLTEKPFHTWHFSTDRGTAASRQQLELDRASQTLWFDKIDPTRT